MRFVRTLDSYSIFRRRLSRNFVAALRAIRRRRAPSRDISRSWKWPPAVYLLRRGGETSRRIRKSVPSSAQVGQGTRARPRLCICSGKNGKLPWPFSRKFHQTHEILGSRCFGKLDFVVKFRLFEDGVVLRLLFLFFSSSYPV